MIRIIPAIDIIEGKCVRLTRGNYATRVIYNEDPVTVARLFEEAGISYLHLVDLDGARVKRPVNLDILAGIVRNTELKIDFGGGIRTAAQIEQIFSLGATQVTIGSMAVHDRSGTEEWIRKFGPDRIILGADVKQDKIAISAWSEESDSSVLPFIRGYIKSGIQYIICTQILRDGVLSGPDMRLYRKIKQTFPELFLIASGGVSTLDDVRELDRMGVDGVIIGKALYEHKITLNELERYLC